VYNQETKVPTKSTTRKRMKFFTCCPPFAGKHHLALMVSLVSCFGIQPQPSPPPTKLFNRSLSLGQVPADWKLSNLTPVPKGGDHKLVSNSHPISLLSLPLKILERIIYNRLLSHLLPSLKLPVWFPSLQFHPGGTRCCHNQLASISGWEAECCSCLLWSLKTFWFSSPLRYPQSSYSSWCHRLIAHLVCWLSIWSHAACCP